MTYQLLLIMQVRIAQCGPSVPFSQYVRTH